ncbi:MAG TPA: metalloregulator ArsR/SmtB family transcription factor [Polyangiaceae bacterium]|jgi:ArsR family transcriptional regulator|nr:metalloregulator ArsR/SmtB family transcription factor [Polyangiaceae bacterium]
MPLSQYVETLALLGDESRLRLCALLRERELCVTDLVRVTGLSQSRVSTHLGRLREAGFVRDRRKGPQSFYALASESLPSAARTLLDDAARSGDPTLDGDQARLHELETERRDGLPESVADELERYYSPGRTWQSLTVGLAALLELGSVLDVGSGDGAAASSLAPYCRSLTCIDTNARLIEVARDRLAKFPHAEARVADVHRLPFDDASFDTVLVFHTLTYAEDPPRALSECARVLAPGGRLVVLCLDEHRQREVTAPYGERHAGFSPDAVRRMLDGAGLDVAVTEVACRESRKPHLQVVLGIADKPDPSSTKKKRTKDS